MVGRSSGSLPIRPQVRGGAGSSASPNPSSLSGCARVQSSFRHRPRACTGRETARLSPRARSGRAPSMHCPEGRDQRGVFPPGTARGRALGGALLSARLFRVTVRTLLVVALPVRHCVPPSLQHGPPPSRTRPGAGPHVAHGRTPWGCTNTESFHGGREATGARPLRRRTTPQRRARRRKTPPVEGKQRQRTGQAAAGWGAPSPRGVPLHGGRALG